VQYRSLHQSLVACARGANLSEWHHGADASIHGKRLL
jgi:hypothetical protein